MARELNIRIQIDNSTQARASLDSVEQGLKQVEAAGGKVSATVGNEASNTGLIGGFASLIRLGLAYGAGRMVEQVIAYGGHLDDLSQKTGISYQGLQRLQYAGELVGTTLEATSSNVVMLQKRLAGGDASALSALKALGLSFDDLRKMAPDKMFEAISTALQGVPEHEQQVLYATQLLGRGGAESLALLLSKIKEIGDQAPLMSDQATAGLDAMGDAWTKWKRNVVASTGEFVGAFASIKTALIQLTGTKSWVDLISGMQAAVLFPSDGITFPKKFHDDTVAALPSMKDALEVLKDVTKETDKLTASIERQEEQAKRREEAYQAWKRATQGMSDAMALQLSYEQRLAQEDGIYAALLRGRTATVDRLTASTANYVEQLKGLDIFAAHDAATFAEFNSRIHGTADEIVNLMPGIESATQHFWQIGQAVMDGAAKMKAFESSFGHMTQQISSKFDTWGTDLSSKVSGMISGPLGKGMGAMASGLLSGLGDMVTGGLSSLINMGVQLAMKGLMWLGRKIAGLIKGNETKTARETFADQMGFGSLAELYDTLGNMGAEGQQLQDVGMHVIGKHDTAGNERWMSAVQAFLQKSGALGSAWDYVGSSTMPGFGATTPGADTGGFGSTMPMPIAGDMSGAASSTVYNITVNPTIQAVDGPSMQSWLDRGGARQIADVVVQTIPAVLQRYVNVVPA